MRAPLALSIFLHLALFVTAWMGLPYERPEILDTEPIIEVEVVADVQAEEAKAEPKPEPKVAALPPPKPTPPPPPSEPEPEVLAVSPPPDEKADPIPEPKPKPKPEKKVEEKPKKKLPPRPRLKPKPPKKDEFESVLKSVEKLEKQKKPKKEKPEKKTFEQEIIEALKKRKDDQPKPADRQLARLAGSVTQSDKDAVRRQIERCWNPPVGAPKAEELIVELQLVVNPDGWVRSVGVNGGGRSNANPYFRAAAESAIRAVLNPRCRTLKLPLEKYEQWKDLIISFDPREMLGR
jgi:outer membrane biosynthesis protein TonB